MCIRNHILKKTSLCILNMFTVYLKKCSSYTRKNVHRILQKLKHKSVQNEKPIKTEGKPNLKEKKKKKTESRNKNHTQKKRTEKKNNFQ